jgi:hypothetical protein
MVQAENDGRIGHHQQVNDAIRDVVYRLLFHCQIRCPWKTFQKIIIENLGAPLAFPNCPHSSLATA